MYYIMTDTAPVLGPYASLEELRTDLGSCPQGAYQDGLRAGRADYRLGRRSVLSWLEIDSPVTYRRAYARGYRHAWLEAERAGTKQLVGAS